MAGLVHVPYAPAMLLEIFALQVLLAFSITAFGVMAAARITQMQSFMALTQMLVMPMFFISGALFPVAALPVWLDVPQPHRPAHLRGRPDAPRRLRAPRHQPGRARTRSTPA